MHWFAGALRVTGRMTRQVAQRSTNCGWGYGETSVANDAKVNLKETHMAAKKKAAKKKVAKKKAAKKK
jgi:hypothetical protein